MWFGRRFRWALAVVPVAPALLVGAGTEVASAATVAERIAGADRYATAAAIAEKAFPGTAATVYLASGTTYADALSAGPAASKVGAPLLITDPDTLPSSISSELARLSPDMIVVVGGARAVSDAVASAASQAAGGAATRRVAGANRYSTAVALVQDAFGSATAGTVYVATGEGFPDALSGASAAASAGQALLLTPRTSLPRDVAEELHELKPTGISILGGTGAVSEEVASQLAQVAPVTRLSGADRFETSVAVAKAAFGETAPPSALLATAVSFADALVGSMIAGARNVPLLLAQQNCLPTPVFTYAGDAALTLIGGRSALSDSVPQQCRTDRSRQISAGDTACAVVADGTVRCWGLNNHGQLGDGTTTDRYTPVRVQSVAGAVGVISGFQSCALITDGTVRCWGENGMDPSGTPTWTTAPTTVPGLGNVVAIAGQGTSPCALLSDGTVRCWGHRGARPDIGYSTEDWMTPVAVPGISGAVGVSGGFEDGCALISDGTVRCWGTNDSGQLGDGTTTDSETPVLVSGVTDAVAISGTHNTYGHVCALIADGTVRCWGGNRAGQLGNGTTNTTANPNPAPVSGLAGAIAISAGTAADCALIADGTVRCWGSNRAGQLGDGTTTDRYTPVAVSGLTNAVAVSQSGLGACAVLSDATARCWGANTGDGTTTPRATPVQVVGYP